MADVEVAVGVGGGHDYGVGVFVWVVGGLEGFAGFPEGVDVRFVLVGFVGFAEFHIYYLIMKWWIVHLCLGVMGALFLLGGLVCFT